MRAKDGKEHFRWRVSAQGGVRRISLTISAESLGRCVPMVAVMARVGRAEMLIYIRSTF